MITSIESIQNFQQISELLSTSGQPDRDQFSAIAAAGFQVVINLAMPDSLDALADEPALVNSLGMEFEHIPVVWTNPRPSDLQRFFEVMDQWEGKRIFVHCARNMRVSAFIFLYRVLRRGEPQETCRRDMEHIWQPNDVWSEFIEASLNRINHRESENTEREAN